MPASIAVIAALPREIKGLAGSLRPDPTLRKEGILLYKRPEAIVVAAGMGSSRVTRALEAALQVGPVQTVISTGLAGACAATVHPGGVSEPALVIDASTGERFGVCTGLSAEVLVSTETIASVQEKARLHDTYGADLVDMEAATLARLAWAHHLDFRAIKAISDAHDFELASLARFTGKHGHFRTAAFALHTSMRPGTWRGAMALGRTSNRALAALTKKLESVLLRVKEQV